MRKKKAAGKARRKDPRWAQIVVVFGALMLMVSGVSAIGVRALIAQANSSVQVGDLFGDSGAGVGAASKLPDGPLNILLVGIDHREGNAEWNSRADTVIILHIPAARNQAFLVPIPRDTMVTVKPFPKSGYGGGRAKMTESFFHGAQGKAGLAGGMELLAGTIKNTPEIGVSFNAAAIINFESFLKVVEELGSVQMCVDQDVTSKHIYVDSKGNPHDVEGDKNPSRFGRAAFYKEGECRRFKPWEALDYSRQRYGLRNGDYDRQRHQLQLMKAIVKEAASKNVLTNPGKLNNVIKAAGSAFILDTRGVSVADFVLSLGGIAANDLRGVRTNAGQINSTQINGVSYEVLSPESVSMFAALRNGTLEKFLLEHPEFNAA